MSTLEQYRASEKEQARTQDLLRLLPKGRHSVLDIGARDGHFSRLLTDHFQEVTALDLEKPVFEFDRITTVAEHITKADLPPIIISIAFSARRSAGTHPRSGKGVPGNYSRNPA